MGKGTATGSCQVSSREMSESEPLMRCRNAYRRCQNLSSIAPQGLVWRLPSSCPDGNRHKEGMTLLQAFIWNLGTCRSDVKRESQAEAPWSERVSMRSTGAESLVVAKKIL
jgi:hypothetical protein